MLRHTDAHAFRKSVAGFSMVVAPLLFLASAILSPRLTSDEARQLAVVGGHADRWYASNALGLLSLLVLVPAILGLMHMLRERQAGLGHLGGALALVGAMLSALGTGVALVIWQMAAASADPRAMTALYERLTGTAGVSVPLVAGGFVLAAGLLVLCAGLVRAQAVHGSAALVLAAGAVLFAVGGATFSTSVLVVAAAASLIGLGSIGLQVLSETTDAWEHTPEQHGFTPLAGH